MPNKRLARIKEKLMPWRFNIVYNPGKTQNAADPISRCKPLHMMCVLAGGILETIHAAMNLVNGDKEDTMMSWDQVHRATQEDGVMVRLMDHIWRGMHDSGLELDKDLRD